MADINLTITIPDAHVATVKSAVELFAKTHGDLESDGTFTNIQTRNYIIGLLKDRVLEFVRVYKENSKVAEAMSEAKTETEAINLI